MMKKFAVTLAIVGVVGALTTGIVFTQDSVSDRAMLGGIATALDDTSEAFTNPVPGFQEGEAGHATFEIGDELFEEPENTSLVGPLMNATTCESCHLSDGRGFAPEGLVLGDLDELRLDPPPGGRGGRGGKHHNGRRHPAPPEIETTTETGTGFLIRLSIPGETEVGSPLPEPTYGGQLQDMSQHDVPAEARVVITYTEVEGQFADGTSYTLRRPIYTFEDFAYGAMHPDVMISPRVAPQVIGLGLLEAVPNETLMALSDPDDSNGDGISGRVNMVWDYTTNSVAIGRFGWKANQPNLIQQNADAYNGDLGLTTELVSSSGCMPSQADCIMVASVSPEPEISADDLHAVTVYMQNLSVPAQRNATDPTVMHGEILFNGVAQCSTCHTPTLITGDYPASPMLGNQTIHPYTDLLLHDMGPGLADGRPDYEATGSEWRTPPLWGIGLFETVNGHTQYLHDGRARNLTEAILWHAGEASASRDAFINMSASDRDALLAFLRSL